VLCFNLEGLTMVYPDGGAGYPPPLREREPEREPEPAEEDID
jgi:hypothetical protein